MADESMTREELDGERCPQCAKTRDYLQKRNADNERHINTALASFEALRTVRLHDPCVARQAADKAVALFLERVGYQDVADAYGELTGGLG
jgi:hypothetical protein